MNSVRMLISTPYLNLKGGAEKVIKYIALKYNADILTCDYDPNKTFEEFKELNVKEIGVKSIYKFIPYGRVSQAINYSLVFYNYKVKEDYDVINAHIAPSHWLIRNNKNLIWYCHTPLREIYDLYKYRMSLRPLYKKPVYAIGASITRYIDKSMVRKIKYIATNSSNTNSRIIKYYNRNDATIINPGVIELERFYNAGDGRYILYPSRFSPNKRQELAIEIFKVFKERYDKDNRYKLILAGALSNDKFYQDYYNRIVELAKSVGSIEIRTNPSDKELLDLYANATAVLFVAMDEDFGIVPLEGMASRKPVLAINEGGPKDYIKNGVDGFLCSTPEEFAEKLNLIINDSSLSESIGKAAYNKIKESYTVDAFLNNFDRYIRSCISKGF
ncbi:MAG: trehalose synthase [Candidatus Micrarchaeota archaeon]|nr:MAG: trehalose synthase [Candidatus Micrarchaeota archaeon]